MVIKKVYSIYMMLFINKVSDEKGNLKVFLLRALSVVGIGFFWISVNNYIDSHGGIVDADETKGILLKVSNTGGGWVV